MALLTLDTTVSVTVSAQPGAVEETEFVVGDFGRNVDGGALSSRRGQKRHVRFITSPITTSSASTLVSKLQKKTSISVTGDYVTMSALAEIHRISSVVSGSTFKQVVEFTLKEV